MILRPAGPSAPFHPPSPARQARSKLSPEAMTAIVMSLAFHGCVGVYLFVHHFTVMELPTPPIERPLTIATVTFPPTRPPPPSREKRQRLRQHAQAPIRLHETPTILGPNPGPAIEAPLGPPGAGGDGLGLGQIAPPAPPAPPAPKPKVILNPDWISKPSGAQLADAYPGRALDFGIAGSATLLCTVGINGQVRDCKVVEETRSEFGFGAAALKLSRWFKVRPLTENGEPVDGAQVRVPIQFGVK